MLNYARKATSYQIIYTMLWAAVTLQGERLESGRDGGREYRFGFSRGKWCMETKDLSVVTFNEHVRLALPMVSMHCILLH